jgi:hypothetical protein
VDAPPGGAAGHLEKLAAILQEREWYAKVVGDTTRAALHVRNPAAPSLAERIKCEEGPQGWRFTWSWREVIGYADDLEEIANRIVKVLAA